MDNREFLLYYQEARKGISSNILGAWKGARLLPYDPVKIHNKIKPKTLPFVTFTNDNGIRVDMVVEAGSSLGDQINGIVDQLQEVCPEPLQDGITFIQQTCLTSLAC